MQALQLFVFDVYVYLQHGRTIRTKYYVDCGHTVVNKIF